MYACAIDAEGAAMVVRWSGRALRDEELAACYRDRLAFAEVTDPQRPVLIFIIVGKECPAPIATHSARLADMIRPFAERPAHYVLVTESPLSRGMLAAIRWLRRPAKSHHQVRFASVDEALTWIRSNTPFHATVATLLTRVGVSEDEPQQRVASR